MPTQQGSSNTPASLQADLRNYLHRNLKLKPHGLPQIPKLLPLKALELISQPSLRTKINI